MRNTAIDTAIFSFECICLEDHVQSFLADRRREECRKFMARTIRRGANDENDSNWQALEERGSSRSTTVSSEYEKDCKSEEPTMKKFLHLRFLVCRRSYIRGMDLNSLTHVIALAQPVSSLEYSHWCGRVGRLGRDGIAISVLPRCGTRQMNTFCEALGLPFKVQRRHQPVDIIHARS